jgi:diguanylate cyclase (GGDEF)-like protein
LTGLANRHWLMDTIQSALTRVPRAGERVAVLYCDLDGFKTINDSLGHAAGDAVLRAVADRIRSTVREQDLVARIGGDEFVVVAQGIRDEPSARLLATKISQAVSRPVEHDGRQVVPTLSIGISVADPGDDAEEVMRLADRALYREKSERD